jgi:hypothetical protein
MSNRKFAVIHNDRFASASREDVQRVLGDLDYLRLIDILRLQPSVRDLEEASAWLASSRDFFGRGRPARTIVCRVLDIITDDNVGTLRMTSAARPVPG